MNVEMDIVWLIVALIVLVLIVADLYHRIEQLEKKGKDEK